MTKTKSVLAEVLTAVLISGCAVAPLSERTFGQKFPIAQSAGGHDVAEIAFSGDAKYESEKGKPLSGDPLLCTRDGIYRISDTTDSDSRVSVRADQEIAVSSVIQWDSNGISKTCWPFVKFTPEKGQKYVVVNERIGGKGLSMLWSSPVNFTCEVSVYRESPTGFERITARKIAFKDCR